VRFSPTTAVLKECIQAGAEFTQKLKKTKRLRTPRQGVTETQIDRTEQAVGRIVGSICVLTTCHDHVHRGVLTSWVSQATFNPPGVMIAIAPEQQQDSLGDPGTKFVLNILNEGRNVRRNFDEQPRDSFADLATKTASNGCLMIEDALAHLECTVQSYLPSGDRTLIYAVVEQGEISAKNGITAIQHRKSGSHY
jgi:flavin reductase (DIM6/NTAB) family NADH-FMN oxidoreductase RutF